MAKASRPLSFPTKYQMEIVTQEQLEEWLRIDPDTDETTLNMLVSSAIDQIEHHTGLVLRPYTDPVSLMAVEPLVPASLKHAVAVLVHASFDNRTGSNEDAWRAVKALCAPWRVPRL